VLRSFQGVIAMLAYAVLGIVVGAIVVLAVYIGRTMGRARLGVTTICPITGKRVHVQLDPKRAVSVLFIETHERVVDCDCWPEQAGCPHTCEASLAHV
jgi:hypothetical protein